MKNNDGFCQVCGKRDAVFCEKCFGNKSAQRRGIFKRRVYKKYGKKCNRCGETDKRCLSIHHKGSNKGAEKYDIDKVEVLCLNCHWGKIHKQGGDD